ncbi:conserved hypothetical protein [Photorhabdus asymbiotica]|uniref:Uncharacterized protein n=2 Tax=Photorhabdus asymbiotica TaxID=291112 RepID=C7BJI1_PHOAA|nr:hypothetical protein BDD30_1437 [Photorhabdus asymbiotica]CAQ85506.1 conserved hypothetical protein [Photorhabdus asymbiotica]
MGRQLLKSTNIVHLGGITRNQHVLHYIDAREVDPLAADVFCPLDEDSYTLLKEDWCLSNRKNMRHP